jgi:hypothetical protein
MAQSLLFCSGHDELFYVMKAMRSDGALGEFAGMAFRNLISAKR